MRFSECVSAGNQRHGLLVIHCHAGKRFANVPGCGERIRLAVGPFRVHVDQAHLNGGERIFEFPVTAVTLVAKPLALRPPVNVLLWLPDVLSTSSEADRLESHRFKSAVTGEDHQIGPRDAVPVFLLNWPEQPTGLVEVRVIGPTVEWSKTLCAIRCAPAAVGDAIRPCTVPGHPNEQRSVVPVVGWPPVL